MGVEEVDSAGWGLWQTAPCVFQLMLAGVGSVPGGVWESCARTLADIFLRSFARHLCEQRRGPCAAGGSVAGTGNWGFWVSVATRCQSGRSQASSLSPSQQPLSKLLAPSCLKHWLLGLHTLGFPPPSLATPSRAALLGFVSSSKSINVGAHRAPPHLLPRCSHPV